MSSDSLAMDDHYDHKPGFFTRWFFSTNHKDMNIILNLRNCCSGRCPFSYYENGII